ncbi:rhodanese-like domain-containing protein [Natronoglycomyces albus]|uniref:Rhodanese-like domain-containing protein n=1 Tax=Natronoglycomyces albus TaxID=2811108 RepID=A0A895XNA9_9ACTN|nr:rhodanese-like domain-containing protein [Natronoglycomyces albus]QSB04879.1 rhodanese-like domain-containing protein [Natronoglycomyces albus]
MTATVDTATAEELIENRARIIDVRSPGEFTAKRIPGSHNVPLDLLQREKANLAASHDDTVVLTCAAGPRSHQAREILVAHGWRNVVVLDGGLHAWASAGNPVEESKGGTWDLERQVRFTAGLIVLLFVLGSLAFEPLKWGAAFIGAGLVFAAISNFCGMGILLSKAPWNRPRANAEAPSLEPLTKSA